MKLLTKLVIAIIMGQLKKIYTSELIFQPFGGTSATTIPLLASDDGGRTVMLQVNFPFHDGNATSVFISVNGLISFGEAVPLSPQDSGNSFPSEQNSRVLAPFWSNNDIRTTGSIQYEIYDDSTTDTLAVLERVSDVIANRTGETFLGRWMLLVEWRDCHPHPHGEMGRTANSYEQQTNTYQAIAISDTVASSYALFIYECDRVQWGADSSMGSIFARVGVSVGGEVLFSHPLSGNASVDQIDCLNDPQSQWVNLLYDISLISPSAVTESLTVSTASVTESLTSPSAVTESLITKLPSFTSSTMFTPIPLPSVSCCVTESGPTDDHTEMEPLTVDRSSPRTDTPSTVIAVVVVVIVVTAVGLILGLTSLVCLIKYKKTKMKVVAQDTIVKVKQSQHNLSLSSTTSGDKLLMSL